MRQGYSAEELCAALAVKLTKNENRKWPDWRTVDPNKAIEHDRSGEEVSVAEAYQEMVDRTSIDRLPNADNGIPELQWESHAEKDGYVTVHNTENFGILDPDPGEAKTRPAPRPDRYDGSIDWDAEGVWGD